MGNDYSTNYSIARQEAYVKKEMNNINQLQNYVSSNRYSGRFENKYSSNQLEGCN